MNPEEARSVIALAAAVDSRNGRANEEEAAMQAAMWAQVCAPVPAGFAIEYVKRWLASRPDQVITPGAIKLGWMDAAAREESSQAREHREAQALAALTGSRRPPAWLPEFMAALPSPDEWRAARASENPGAAMAVLRKRAAETPIPTLTDNPVTDSGRDRTCGVRDCACTHTECRGGWLDDPAYPATRCGMCYDTVAMRGEPVGARRARR